MNNDVFEKIDKAIQTKSTGGEYISKQMEQMLDNIRFEKEYEQNPPTTKKYDIKIFGVETINLNPFLELRIWQRSIYVTDKLMRLVAGSRLDFLKRYLRKKNKMTFDYWWLLIIMVMGGVGLMIVLMFLLPMISKVKIF